MALAAWSWTVPQAAAPAQDRARPATAVPAATGQRSALDTYCVSCHNQRLKTGGLALDAMDLARVPADAATWERVIRKLRTGAMPPAGMPRPDAATRDALIASLESTIDRAARSSPFPGHPSIHRLNRAEYAQRHPRSAVARGGRGGAAAAGRARLRLRQHRRDAGCVAGAARALLRRGSRDFDAGGWRRFGRRRRGPGVSRRGRSLAGPAQRRPAARHERRHGRAHHAAARRRVRDQGRAVQDQSRPDSRAGVCAPAGDRRRRPARLRREHRRHQGLRGHAAEPDGVRRCRRGAPADTGAAHRRPPRHRRHLRRPRRGREHAAPAGAAADDVRHVGDADRAAARPHHHRHGPVQPDRCRGYAEPARHLQLSSRRAGPGGTLRPRHPRQSGPPRLSRDADGRRRRRAGRPLPRMAARQQLRLRHRLRAAAHPGRAEVPGPDRARARGAARHRVPGQRRRAGLAPVVLPVEQPAR